MSYTIDSEQQKVFPRSLGDIMREAQSAPRSSVSLPDVRNYMTLGNGHEVNTVDAFVHRLSSLFTQIESDMGQGSTKEAAYEKHADILNVFVDALRGSSREDRSHKGHQFRRSKIKGPLTGEVTILVRTESQEERAPDAMEIHIAHETDRKFEFLIAALNMQRKKIIGDFDNSILEYKDLEAMYWFMQVYMHIALGRVPMKEGSPLYYHYIPDNRSQAYVRTLCAEISQRRGAPKFTPSMNFVSIIRPRKKRLW